MIEIFQILFLYLIFSFTIITPLNIFNYTHKQFNILDIASFNLVINLSMLLLISLVSYSLNEIQKLLIVYYPSILIFLYFKDFKKLFKSQLKFLPILIIFLLFRSVSQITLNWVGMQNFFTIKSLYFYEGRTLADLKEFAAYHFHPHLGSYLWAFF